MKIKIIVDSTSNLKTEDYNTEEVPFEVVPLSLIIGEKDYVDDCKNDLKEIVSVSERSKAENIKITTACPSPQAYLDAYQGADKYIVITLSQKVSGSYNSACVARDMLEHPEDVFVMDSYACCGIVELLVRHAIEWIKEGLSFEEIQEKLVDDRSRRHIVFIIEKFDSLIKTGRVSKIVAGIASKLKIKPIGIEKDGEIHILEIARTVEGSFKRLLNNVGKFYKECKEKLCVISHTQNSERALKLKEALENELGFENVIIRDNQAVISYYSLSGAIMVSF